MSDNKFISRLKGTETTKSVVEIKNDKLIAPFTNVPHSTDVVGGIIDDKDTSVVVAKSAQNWKLNGSSLAVASALSGDGNDYTGEYNVSGAGLWVDAVYTFPTTGDPKRPVAEVFTASTKWVLKLCGKNLLTSSGNTIDFTLLVKIGTSNLMTKTFTVKQGANAFCRTFVIDFSESAQQAIKAQGGANLTLQLLCADSGASATIYNGMTVLSALQRRIDADAVSSNHEVLDDFMNSNIIPDDYFSNADYIDQIEDGGEAYAVFQRDGDVVELSGWTPKEEVARKEEIIVKSETIPTATADLAGAIYQYTGVTTSPYEHGYIYECVETTPGVYGWQRIDVQPGGSRGRFLSLWNCVTGLAESNPPISPYEYKTGDYFVVGAVSTATPAVNYKPDGTSYITGTASTTVEAKEVAIDDTYFFDGTTWKLQSNSNKTVTYANIAGDIYDSASATTALNAKQNTISDLATIRSGAAAGATAVQPGDLATVATSGSYNDLSDKPTVNNATITIKQGGVDKGSFTLNQDTDDTIELDSGSSDSYHPDLFDHKWADHILNDVQWLRADTFSWQSGAVYKSAYKHLRNDMYQWYSWENNGTTIYTKKAYPEVGEKAYSDSALTTEVGEITDVTDTLDITVEKITVNSVVYDSVSGSNISPTTETVGGVTVQYIPAEDGHKIVTDFHESEVADIYTATGVAWYYIIDYGFKRFKLPRTKFGMTGLRDTVGNYVAPGLPNITGTIGDYYLDTATGAFALDSSVNINRYPSGNGGGSYNYKSFNASRSSSIYGNSTTVQAPATQMYLYFYVGEFTQTALENTAGLNASLFNDKADLDLSNVNSTGKANSVSWVMPDWSRAISTNLSGINPITTTSDTYTCPSDGWIYFYAKRIASGNTLVFYLNGNNVHSFPAYVANYANLIYPVSAGDVIKFTSDSTSPTWYIDWCNFVPCKGV